MSSKPTSYEVVYSFKNLAVRKQYSLYLKPTNTDNIKFNYMWTFSIDTGSLGTLQSTDTDPVIKIIPSTPTPSVTVGIRVYGCPSPDDTSGHVIDLKGSLYGPTGIFIPIKPETVSFRYHCKCPQGTTSIFSSAEDSAEGNGGTEKQLTYVINTTQDLTEPSSGSGIYAPIKVTESDLQSIGLSMSSLDKTKVAFNDNAGNPCEFRREYWNTSLGEALFIVKVQKDGSALPTLGTSDTISLNLTTNNTEDLSSGPETCLLAVEKKDSGNVVDISGNSGYDSALPSGITWGNDPIYGDYLYFNGIGTEVTNTDGSSNIRTVLMFFDSFGDSTPINMFFNFYRYAAVEMSDQIGFITLYNNYMSNATINNNVWYHLGAVMGSNENVINNKIYINGENKPVSVPNSTDENAVFQDYIKIGGEPVDGIGFHGYESQIYYFDRELSAGEVYGFYKFGDKTATVTVNHN